MQEIHSQVSLKSGSSFNGEIQYCANSEEMLARALVRAQEVSQTGRRAVVLVSSSSAVVAAKEQLASAGGWGIEITTPDLWLQDRWELQGDGRRLVPPVFLRTTLLKAAKETFQAASAKAARYESVMEEVVRHAMGSARFSSSEALAVLSTDEQRIVAAIQLAARVLDAQGLVAPAEAAYLLAQKPALNEALILVGLDEASLPAALYQLLSERGQWAFRNERRVPEVSSRPAELNALLEHLYHGPERAPVEPTGAVRFSFASGPVAQDQAIIDALAMQGRTLVITPNPWHSWETLGPRLAAAGFTLGFRGAVALSQTALGRELIALADFLLSDGPAAKASLIDALSSPLELVDEAKRSYWDAQLRSDRALGQQAILEKLSEDTGLMVNAVVNALQQGRYEEAIELYGSTIHRPPLNNTMQIHQSALSALRECAAAVRANGLDLSDLRELWMQASITLQGQLTPPNSEARLPLGPVVHLSSLKGATEELQDPWDRVVVTQLTVDEMPFVDQGSPGQTLLAKLGISLGIEDTERIRRQFYDVLAAPSHQVVLERSLANSAGDALYPAVLFQEVVDCYVKDPQSQDDLIKGLEIPQPMLPFSTTALETEFIQARASVDERKATQTFGLESPGFLGRDSSTSLLLSPYRLPEFGIDLVLSPSAIETYLECPFKWFLSRRIGMKSLDEGFGPLERGTFIHGVLQQYFLRMQEAKRAGETATAEEQEAWFTKVFDEQVAIQETLPPGKRYLAINGEERREYSRLKEELRQFLREHRTFLPNYERAFQEWPFGYDQVCSYGGIAVHGRLDRLDTDGIGHGVVIDYKTGKVDKRYSPTVLMYEDSYIPRKVQTLIYAKAVEQSLDLEVVAALYLNPLTQEISGAYDRTILSPLELGGINPKQCGLPLEGGLDYRSYAEAVEEAVGLKLQELQAGNIAPQPVDELVCRSCPAGDCPRRLS